MGGIHFACTSFSLAYSPATDERNRSRTKTQTIYSHYGPAAGLIRAVIIGGGFGGIAAALRARAKGYDVTLIDRCPRLGGRAQVFERGGYRHDAGPTVLTAPFLFEELFALFGKNLPDYADLRLLTPWYRFRYMDGTTFDYGGTAEDTKREIARFSPEDADGYDRLLEASLSLAGRGRYNP